MNAYKTLRFERGAIPAGLKKNHSLKAKVRAELDVLEGSLVFVDDAGLRTPLKAGERMHIDQRVHHLEEADDACIEVRFYRVE